MTRRPTPRTVSPRPPRQDRFAAALGARLRNAPLRSFGDEHHVPTHVALTPDTRSFLAEIGASAALSSFFERASLDAAIEFGGLLFDEVNAMRAKILSGEDEDTGGNERFLREGLLVVGSGLNGDPIVVDLPRGECVGFIAWEELSERDDDASVRDGSYVATPFEVGSFCLAASLFAYDSLSKHAFPVDADCAQAMTPVDWEYFARRMNEFDVRGDAALFPSSGTCPRDARGAFFGDEDVKKQCLVYERTRKGSARHVEVDWRRFSTELGIPSVVPRLGVILGASLPKPDFGTWPVRFLEAIPVGSRLEDVWPEFAAWLLKDSLRLAGTAKLRNAMRRLAKHYAVRTPPEDDAWKAMHEAAHGLCDRVFRREHARRRDPEFEAEYGEMKYDFERAMGVSTADLPIALLFFTRAGAEGREAQNASLAADAVSHVASAYHIDNEHSEKKRYTAKEDFGRRATARLLALLAASEVDSQSPPNGDIATAPR